MFNTKKKKSYKGVELITDTDSFVAESYLKIQTNIQFSGIDKKLQVIAVTSADQSEGKSTTIGNLAVLYAEKGMKVLILNLDLRRPSIHNLFHIENKVGIVDYVTDNLPVEKIVKHVDGVDIINSGSRTPFPTKVLESPKLITLIEELRKKYDYILIDTPPIFVFSDALISIPFTDGYIVVCSQHSTYKKQLVETVNTLKEKNANIIGIVMTMVTESDHLKKNGYGHSYGYGYGYGYGYKEDKKKTESKTEEKSK